MHGPTLNLHILGQPNTFLAAGEGGGAAARGGGVAAEQGERERRVGEPPGVAGGGGGGALMPQSYRSRHGLSMCIFEHLVARIFKDTLCP